MIPIIMSSLVLAALLAGEPRAVPRECMLSAPRPAKLRREAEAVFVGRVISQRDSLVTMRHRATNRTYEVRETEYTMVIDAAWKLPARMSDTMRVWTWNGAEDAALAVGESWMVYAGSRYSVGRLFAFGCSLSKPAHRAADDFAALGRPSFGALPPRGYPRSDHIRSP